MHCHHDSASPILSIAEFALWLLFVLAACLLLVTSVS
jgi:hypothetical protein